MTDRQPEDRDPGHPSVWSQIYADAYCERTGSVWTRDGVIKRGAPSLIVDPPLTWEWDSERYGRVVSGRYGRLEKRAAWCLAQMCQGVRPPTLEARSIGLLARLDESQRYAVEMALSHPVSVICGGPGTGKTTIAEILCAATGLDRTLGLSPTGKGADRLMESLGIECYTCHRAAWQVQSGKLDPSVYDLILCDESGMLDTETLEMILRYLTRNRRRPLRLVFLGDPGQLPSVGPGRILDEMIEVLPTARLEVLHRTDQKEIAQACKLARDGRLLSGDSEHYLLIAGDYSAALTQYRICVARYGLDESRLITLHRHDVQEINARCLDLIGGRPPIVCTRNNYRVGVMNGQQGFHFGRALRFGEIECTPDAIKWAYAYGATCHRSQGGQWDGVVVWIPSARWLTREWLLTALSRSVKRLVLVVGDEARIERVLARCAKPSDRVSCLAELITRSGGI